MPQPARDQQVLLVIMGALIGIMALCGLGNSGSSLSGTAQIAMFEGEITDALKEEGVPDAEVWVGQAKSIAMRGIWTHFAIQMVSTVAYFWLAVGSIMCLRWGQKLLLALGWMWVGTTVLGLVAGLGTIPLIVDIMSGIYAASGTPMGGPAQISFIVGIVFVFGFAFNLIPGIILVIVYGLRDVRLTVLNRDPKDRWTDAVPIPVLALWTFLVSWAMLFLAVSPALGSVMWFPLGIQGWQGVVLGLVLAVVFGWTAWAVAKLHPAGWWASMIVAVLGIFLAVYGIMMADVWAILESAKLPEVWIAKLKAKVTPEIDLLLGAINRLWLPIAIFGGGILAYLGWLKKYFDVSEPQDEPEFR